MIDITKNPIGAEHDKVISKKYSPKSCRYLVSLLKIFTTVMIAQTHYTVKRFEEYFPTKFSSAEGSAYTSLATPKKINNWTPRQNLTYYRRFTLCA